MDVSIDYRPQPRQALLHRVRANEVLFGGAAGPGKSHALRFEALLWCLRIPGLAAYLFRRTVPELEKNHILPCLDQFPRGVGRYIASRRTWEFGNGSRLHLCACGAEKDVYRYQGAEIHLLLIDELTALTEFQYDFLRGRVRCSLKVPEHYRCRIRASCAPPTRRRGPRLRQGPLGGFRPAGGAHPGPRNHGGMVRCHIPASLDDNPILKIRTRTTSTAWTPCPNPCAPPTATAAGRLFRPGLRLLQGAHVIAPRPVPKHAPCT
jgi:hypothetical protein